jgi:hypothetical protein
MKRFIFSIVSLALFCCAGSAQTPAANQPASNVSKVLPATTPLGTGPFKAIMEVDPTLAKHTVYRPDDMNAVDSVKLPIMSQKIRSLPGAASHVNLGIGKNGARLK